MTHQPARTFMLIAVAAVSLGTTDLFAQAAPVVTSISPTRGPSTGFTGVTINGANFVPGATSVTFGAAAGLSVNCSSTTQCNVLSPIHGPMTVSVRVTTPGGTSADTPADDFTFVEVPAVASISPTGGATAGGTVVTINGKAFVPGGTLVRFGTSDATGVSCPSTTQCTATSPPGTGVRSVLVMTDGGGWSADTAADDFTYTDLPVITGIQPRTGSPAGGTVVTISGYNFVAGATSVAFGASAATNVSCASTTECTATSPAGTGPVSVRVTTAAGTSANTAADDFNYVGPVLSSITPASGPPSGGTIVSITGSNFTAGSTSVTFGGTPATSVSCSSTTRCTATAPPGSGSVRVRVTTPNGTNADTSGDDFTYVVPSNCTSPPTFVAGGSFPSAAWYSIVSADLDDDGHADLVAANPSANNVAVLLGSGTGTFGAATTFPTGAFPTAVAVGDLNGDGRKDLAVANENSNDVSVLIGAGDGTFGAATNYTAGGRPTGVAIADFDSDGVSDLAVTNTATSDISLFRGLGGGTFAAGTSVPTGFGVYGLTVGDFNGDGHSDVAAVRPGLGSSAIVGFGTGSGTFPAIVSVSLGVGREPVSLVSGDFNGDGSSDLAAANSISNNVTAAVDILEEGSVGQTIPAGITPIYLTAADINGDGRVDLIVANSDTRDLSVVLGGAVGVFGGATTFSSGVNARSIAAADFNEDGRLDLAVTDGGVTILLAAAPPVCVPVVSALNTSTGPPEGGTVVTIGGANFSAAPGGTTVTFDGVAASSVICASTSSCSATAPAGSGTANVRVTVSGRTSADTPADDFTYVSSASCTPLSFASPVTYTAGTNPRSVVYGDFNSDGHKDLAVANRDSSDVSVFLGSAAGAFGAATHFATGTNAVAVAAGDFDADGDTDLVTLVDSGAALLSGDGTGAFELAGGRGQFLGTSLAPADFNSDGRSDVAVGGELTRFPFAPSVSILFGEDSDAGLAGPTALQQESPIPRTIAVGDFNGDGHSDAVSGGNGNLHFWPGAGTGSFGAATVTALPFDVHSLAAGDFNGDGELDVAMAHRSADGVSIALGGGDGSFGAPVTSTAGTSPSSVAVADFNGDGHDDLVVANEGSGNVSLLLGNGSGGFAAALNFAAASGPTAVVAADFDRDAHVDLAVTHASGVSILLNASAAGTLSLGSASYAVTEGAGTATVTVLRTAGTDCSVSVTYGTTNGTAVAGSDFTAVAGTLTFDPGVTSRSFTIAIANDTTDEIDESFSVAISSPTGGATAGVPLTASVTITDDDDPPTITLSASAGSIPETGGSSTVTVTLSTPSAREVAVELAFSGTATRTADYAPSATLITIPAGATAGSITLTSVSDATDEPDETVVVDALAVSNAVEATPQQVAITLADDDAAPALAISSVTQQEGSSGATSFVFTVSLTGSTAQTVTINYATADGTATAGSDYAATSGTLTFAPGEAAQSVVVSVAGDSVTEPDETFAVILSSPVNATLTTATGTGTIQNDEALPTLAVNDVTQVETDSGTTMFVFTVTLTGSTSETVSVDYGTADGTATAGSDYTATSGTLTFSPGTATRTIQVTVAGDPVAESDETFAVTLTGSTNAAITRPSGVGTMRNDDPLPALTIANVVQAEGDSGTKTFSLVVTLTGATQQVVTAGFATADGTATAGSDYTATTGTLTFAPGETSKTVDVVVRGDVTSEADETFTVTLSSATNALIAAATGTGTIQNDESSVADLSASKTASPGPYVLGGEATFNITVTNDGPATATDVQVTDVLPPAMTFVSAVTSQGTCSGASTVVCTLGTVMAGASVTVTVTVRLSSAGTFTNTATVTSSAADATAATGSSTITIMAAAAASIPTASEWVLMLLAFMLAAMATMKLRA